MPGGTRSAAEMMPLPRIVIVGARLFGWANMSDFIYTIMRTTCYRYVKTRHSFYGTEYGQNFAMSIGAIDDNVKGSLGCTFRGSRDDLSQ
jgi:hypothetical protein